MEISKALSANRAAIASAAVVLVSPTVVFISNLNEAQLKQFGCNCKVAEQGGLAPLLDLLVGADIATLTPFDKQALDTRIGVYLRWRDGQCSRMVFDGAGRYGIYDSQFWMRAAAPGFGAGLRAWAAFHFPGAGTAQALRAKKKGLEIAL